MNDYILEIRDLAIHFYTDDGDVAAVGGVDLKLERGDTLGLVGETGAGKTTTAKGILRLIPNPPGKIIGGEILFEGKDVMKMTDEELREMRGGSISMIFQDPMTALNPVLTVGDQIAEMIALHSDCSKSESMERAKEMLKTVGIAPERAGEFPHQFSGIALFPVGRERIDTEDHLPCAVFVVHGSFLIHFIGQILFIRDKAINKGDELVIFEHQPEIVTVIPETLRKFLLCGSFGRRKALCFNRSNRIQIGHNSSSYYFHTFYSKINIKLIFQARFFCVEYDIIL